MTSLLSLTLLLSSSMSLASTDVQPAIDLIARNFGPAAVKSLNLTINMNLSSCSSPCFSVTQEKSNGVVSIVASAMSELTYGVGYYTRFSCGLTVGWAHGGGSHVTGWSSGGCHGPKVLQPITMERAVPYTYLDNVCTHSYSYAWYNENAWIKHIDWMALRGVNVFLAMTGQEEIQYKAFIKMGFKDKDIREFFNGPAYLTWSRGQSMQSVGSSALPEGGSSGLPRSWMKAQWQLQKKILNLTRALGIIGVLPAFQGNLPPQAKTMWPKANITNTHHARPGEENQTKGDCSWVASTDPVFGRVADVWMQTLLGDFGTDHWYVQTPSPSPSPSSTHTHTHHTTPHTHTHTHTQG